jgi:hypothetical protein
LIYCGRACYGWPKSPLGNHIHASSLEAYAAWLAQKIIDKDKTVCAAMAEIQPDSILACWCHPKPCHCEAIWKVWQAMRDGEDLHHFIAAAARSSMAKCNAPSVARPRGPGRCRHGPMQNLRKRT